jgi:hypothetical protein
MYSDPAAFAHGRQQLSANLPNIIVVYDADPDVIGRSAQV